MNLINITFRFICFALILLGSCKKNSNTNEEKVEQILTGTFTDSRDGQIYKTVKIGNQWWFAQNLNYTIGNSWCYNNSADSCAIYGRLYDWQTALTACPPGWHLPNEEQWELLIKYLGGKKVAGGKMKSITNWRFPNGGATNSSGFSAIPAGIRNPNGSFGYIDQYLNFWSSTSEDSSNAWFYYLNNIDGYITIHNTDKQNGFSCRCIKD